MRELDKQIHENKKSGWNIYRGYYEKEPANNFYFISRQEDVIQEGQEEDDFLMFEEGTTG
jgi:hypothetical protein